MTDVFEGGWGCTLLSSCTPANVLTPVLLRESPTVPPGSIIRSIKRLEELLRQMCAAAKAIGNTELENKFAEGTCLGPQSRQCGMQNVERG